MTQTEAQKRITELEAIISTLNDRHTQALNIQERHNIEDQRAVDAAYKEYAHVLNEVMILREFVKMSNPDWSYTFHN